LEASTIQAPVAVARFSVPAPLLRLRSDEQLVAMFRAGSEDAFRAIHDRYRARLLAYARQMLAGSRQDAEDALQDVFVRAYSSLRANDRPVSLRAWLYRVAHNRCIDQLRRPAPAPCDVFEVSRTPVQDPPVEIERREELRRLVVDVGRLPDQQRSALLMREMQGLSYEELALALGVSVAAVKSLLVRARGGLIDAAQARETACLSVRQDLALACDRGVRASGLARRHVRDCPSCREYRDSLRSVRRRVAALFPVGPLGALAQWLGLGGSGAAAGGAGGATALGGAGAVATATKVALVCAAAAVTASGAVESVHHNDPGRSAGLGPRAAAHARRASTRADSTAAVTRAGVTRAVIIGPGLVSGAAIGQIPAAAGRSVPGRSSVRHDPTFITGQDDPYETTTDPVSSTTGQAPATPGGPATSVPTGQPSGSSSTSPGSGAALGSTATGNSSAASGSSSSPGAAGQSGASGSPSGSVGASIPGTSSSGAGSAGAPGSATAGGSGSSGAQSASGPAASASSAPASTS
jgi:RNA polymerase sigma factor (sigma-70 family)